MNLLRLITARKGAAALDPDAQAFITAAGITNPTQQTAINQLVLSLKANNLWTKMTAIYPFVGGTASSHSYNLVNPAQYQITWNGTVTHNSNGITGNGSTGYGNLNVAPNSIGSQNDAHCSLYCRNNTATAPFDLYSDNVGETQSFGIILQFGGNGFYTKINTNSYTNVANASAVGFYASSRTSSTLTKGYKNGSAIVIGTSTSTGRNAFNLYICARNNAGTADLFSSRNYAFATVGSGLTDADVSNLYTAVQAFQTTLGRQV